MGVKTPDFLQQTFDIKVGDEKELSSICHTSDEDTWEQFEQRKKRSVFGRRKSTYTLRGDGFLQKLRSACKHHHEKKEDEL